MMHQQKNTSTAVNNSEKDEKRLTLSSLVRVCGHIFETRRARTASSADATENTAPILAWLCRPLSVNAWLWNQLWKDCFAQLSLMRSNPGLTSSSLIWDEEGNSQANLGMVLRPISKNVNNVTDCNVSCNVSNNLLSQRVAKSLSVHVHAVRAGPRGRWVAEATTPPKDDFAKRSTTVKPVAITGHHRRVASVHKDRKHKIQRYTKHTPPTGKRKPKACATMAKKTMPRVFPNWDQGERLQSAILWRQNLTLRLSCVANNDHASWDEGKMNVKSF